MTRYSFPKRVLKTTNIFENELKNHDWFLIFSKTLFCYSILNLLKNGLIQRNFDSVFQQWDFVKFSNTSNFNFSIGFRA